MPRIGRMNLGRRFWSLRNHHLHCRGATVEPSPAFLRSGGRAHTRFSRGATVDIASQLMINRRSATKLAMESRPGLKKAGLGATVAPRLRGCCRIYFSKTITAGLNSERHYATGADQAIFVKLIT